MTISSIPSYLRALPVALGLCGAAGVLASCTGAPTQSSSAVSNAASQPAGASAWAASSLRMRDLLYVSHKDGSLDMYAYPSGRLQGHLENARAAGLCSDGNGDVFVPSGSEVFEYAHAGTRPIAILRGSLGGVAQACAVDPTSGNLAVLGGFSPKFGVALYAGAAGVPKTYGLHVAGGYWSSTFDNEGNLFVASAGRSAVDLVELPKGANRFASIAWSGPRPAGFGSIQWDGQALALSAPADASGTATISRYSVIGARAALIGQTQLKSAGTLGAFAVRGTTLIAPGAAEIVFYGYPAGGDPTTIIKDDRGPQAAAISPGMKAGIDVATYHYDNFRTGWDDAEYTLSYKNVNASSFGLIASVTLNDQVDTQPLLVRDELTSGTTRQDVVYVATESNTVYAINAATGAILFSTNLGTPVQEPLGCNNNGPNVGIDGTPVLDLTANVMYVIAYTMVGSVPTYVIHELSLSNLTDVVSPVVVTASHTLTNGSTYYFNATYQRQRPALLEANGNIYAGFGSFCDFAAGQSRGWVLGWQAGSLTPLAANQLNDSLGSAPDNFFLSSVWMSGYGIAADPSGNIYFVTGNSEPKTYNGETDIQESAVKMNGDLTQMLSIFTPSNVNALDRGDVDFGSGGMLLLPESSSSGTPLAAAAGKTGTMFLMNQDSLGGYNPSENNVLAEEAIGGCWCGASYYDADKASLPRIVSSGGDTVMLWNVQSSPSVALSLAGSSPGLSGGQDSGFFTAVSSNGSHPNAIIWAVARPNTVPGSITLFAFKSEPSRKSSTLPTLWQGKAGYWNSSGGNSNVVPVVANGKVYVASYEQLDILGLGGTKKARKPSAAAVAYQPTANAPHQLTGTLLAVSGSSLTLRSRAGQIVRVDDSVAVRNERSADLVVGEPFTVRGKYDASGVLHAAFILRAKPSPSVWPPDR